MLEREETTILARMPRVSGKDVLRALERDGWYVHRSEGSHHQLRHPARFGKVTVPYHGNETLDIRVLNNILKQANMTKEELIALL
jgi:predicted RNA binding protein YcfA (HicA-like mRNA interferase family)